MSVFIQKFLAAVVFLAPSFSFAGDPIYLFDKVAWAETAAALRNNGLEVVDSESLGDNTGIIIRVVSATNDLSADNGSLPFGDHATALDIVVRCRVGDNVVDLASALTVGGYVFLGKTASQKANSIRNSHAAFVAKSIKDYGADIMAVAKKCDQLAETVVKAERQQKSRPKSKK